MAKTNFIRFNAIKTYINDIKKMRASDPVLNEAQRLAKESKRKTVMGPDMTTALEKYIGKKNLAWQEISKEIIRQNPTDLGSISKAINEFIQKAKPS